MQQADILVGTACAGTGLDMDVALVIVVGLPFSTELLLQWAGRLRIDGKIFCIVPQSHMRDKTELSEIISNPSTSAEFKYRTMCACVDGPNIQSLATFTGPNQDFQDIKRRMTRISQHLQLIRRLPPGGCKVGYVIIGMCNF
jgi:superfamily II DNA/RNA helicase